MLNFIGPISDCSEAARVLGVGVASAVVPIGTRKMMECVTDRQGYQDCKVGHVHMISLQKVLQEFP